jgi:hypothetical protein
MKCLLSTIIILCLLDAIFTMLWLSTGIAIESNPLMEFLINKSHLLFITVKMALTFASIHVLYKYKDIKGVLTTGKILAILYLVIIIYHILGYILS